MPAHIRALSLITMLYPAFWGSSCSATGRSLERRRRARLPLSVIDALLRKRSALHPCGSPVYPPAALWRERVLPSACLLRFGRLCRLSARVARLSHPAWLPRILMGSPAISNFWGERSARRKRYTRAVPVVAWALAWASAHRPPPVSATLGIQRKPSILLFAMDRGGSATITFVTG